VGAEREAYQSREQTVNQLKANAAAAKKSGDETRYRAAVAELRTGMGQIFGQLATVRRETVTAKCRMPEIIAHIDDAVEQSGKVILFAHHKAAVAILAERFGKSAVQLVGDTPMPERQTAVDRFQTDPDCNVFIGSIQAAGVGITLTAASHVIFLESDWVPGNISQAEDRAHRIGQRESVLVQHLVLDGSIDGILLKRIIAKQEVIDRALDKSIAAEEMEIS
jgi:SWI/SNF-related matrix-associated actin-dependent regulator 1 of chromatin subfamily A